MSGLASLFESLISAAIESRRTAAPKGAVPPLDESRFLIGTSMPFGTMGPPDGSHLYADSTGNQHELLVARPGGGKTTYVARRIDWECGMGRTTASIDFLGDGAERVLRTLAANRPDADVALVDLLDDRFVPNLSVLQGPGSPQAKALAAERVVKAHAESWGVRIGYRFVTAAEALSAAGYGIPEMAALFSVGGGFRGEIVGGMADGPAKEALREFESLSDDQKRAQWAELASKLYPWVSERSLETALTAESFVDLGRFLDNQGWTLLVSLGTTRFPAAAVIGKLLVEAIERHVMARAELPPERRGRFRIFLDEAKHLSGLGVGSILTEGRRLGANVTLCTQYLGMLDAPLRASLRANCATKIIMGVGGPEAAELAEEIVTDLPREKIVKEIQSLGVGEAIVALAGRPSVKVSMPDFPAPQVADDVVDRLRLRAMEETGTSRELAEAAFRERRERIASLDSGARPAKVVRGRRPSPREADGG